jgi:Dyp-type peroxidase family
MVQMSRDLELNDVQRIVIQGFPKRRFSRWALLNIDDPTKAKQWLDSIEPHIGRADRDGRRNPAGKQCFAVAFTLAGMEKLGLPNGQAKGFGTAFSLGMRSRAQILGDVGESAHDQWHWGGADEDVDILVISYAKAAGDLNLWHGVGPAESGLTEVSVVNSDMPDDIEHFGFRDGISQPYIDGIETSAASTLGSQFDNRVQPGEFILGYPNEGEHFADCPSVPAALDQENNLLPFDMSNDRRSLGLNSSYLVLRQLEQRTDRFDELVDAFGAGDPELFKAKLIGRWPSGAPLVMAPNEDNPNLEQVNDFGYYATDRWGYRCPLGAHIRRANPRDSLVALNQGRGPKDAARQANTHRIIRRGRTYQIIDGAGGVGEQGLMFACINASIDQQFEFIQESWINETSFSELRGEDDPVVGMRQYHNPGVYTIHRPGANRTINNLNALIRVRGGSYFFLPSLRAIRFLIALQDPVGPDVPDPDQGSASSLSTSSLNH